MSDDKTDGWQASNYCIGFLDLLGQRNAMRGQSLLPSIGSIEDRQAFSSVIRETIGVIFRLQKGADEMLRGALERDPNSPFRAALSEDQKPIWDQMHKTRVHQQRWSDGLVFFTSLSDPEIKCRMGGIFWIIAQAGCHCFLGLAGKQPVRGAIDVAWGVELRPGELYGPAVACAYELESEVAKHPRIVVGQRVIEVLEECRRVQATNFFTAYDRVLAEKSLEFLKRDDDGVWIVDYLNGHFRAAVTQGQHLEMYRLARAFAAQQLAEHAAAGDKKLAERYERVVSYFDRHAEEC